ncbi:MAG TPA: asparagine synthase (glutamine-hydrolyzing) [Prolixibacteraceae bacterium]|jgi:asparagine synthase (glutamine-hydrolysing)|nr:asparagine synthase (glutamine-hydrolyzing) [Prolixibacteraceae bacterium]
MCGFSGVISNGEIHQQTIVDSISAIKHRGPDDTLVFSGDQQFYACELSNAATLETYPSLPEDKKSNLFLGFNRLSIVDLSQKAMQPFFDEEREVAMMLNGEIYNYIELRNEFLADESFVSQSDSEVAFRLYLKYGDEFVHLLRGMFSIVVYDFKHHQLKAWRDRLGMKPFYYALKDGIFVFSSEMKGLFATQVIQKEINYQGLAYSMYLGTCPSPLTIFKGISSLQAGSKLEFSLLSGEIKTACYWHLKYVPSGRTIGFEEFNSDLEELCRLHSSGDVDKALMLSGGMDSGTLAHYFSKFDPELKCLNIYAKNHSIDERPFAQENASNARLDIEFLEIPTSPSDHQIDGCLNAEEEPNCIPEPAVFLCNKARVMGIKVLYSALGPDELFGGYNYFATVSKFEKLSGILKFIPSSFVPGKYRSKFSEVKRYGLENYALICRRLFHWDDIVQFLQKKGELIPIHPIQYLNNQVDIIYPEFKNLPLLKKVSYLEIFYFISSHHTFRSDQPSMRFSIEMRFPFLDHLFIEKYFNQTDTFDHLDKYLKPQFREYVSNILPRKIIGMEKKGFSMPTEYWIHKETVMAKHDIKTTRSTQHWYLKMLSEIEAQ